MKIKNNTNIIGEIPARLGSQRVRQKNIKDLCGKPLISYAIEAANNSSILTDFFVNTESDLIGEVAQSYNAKYYKRKPELSTDTAKQDEFNYDFIKGTNADTLVLINPVCPLINSKDIDDVINSHFKNNNTVTVTCLQEQLHAFCEGKPINFDTNQMLPRTQDIPSVDICTWSICVWDAHAFCNQYEKYG